jgi:hypothetical protein
MPDGASASKGANANVSEALKKLPKDAHSLIIMAKVAGDSFTGDGHSGKPFIRAEAGDVRKYAETLKTDAEEVWWLLRRITEEGLARVENHGIMLTADGISAAEMLLRRK